MGSSVLVSNHVGYCIVAKTTRVYKTNNTGRFKLHVCRPLASRSELPLTNNEQSKVVIPSFRISNCGHDINTHYTDNNTSIACGGLVSVSFSSYFFSLPVTVFAVTAQGLVS